MGVFVGVSVRYAARRGYTVGGEGRLRRQDEADAVVFRFLVVNWQSRAPFSSLVLSDRALRWGIGDEPMS